jgi:adenylate cyclase
LRALRAGARDFVSKPLDMPEVLIRVHNMIELRLLRLEMELLRAQLVDAQNTVTT